VGILYAILFGEVSILLIKIYFTLKITFCRHGDPFKLHSTSTGFRDTPDTFCSICSQSEQGSPFFYFHRFSVKRSTKTVRPRSMKNCRHVGLSKPHCTSMVFRDTPPYFLLNLLCEQGSPFAFSTLILHISVIFMPLPLVGGGVMFSGCPSICPSVCPYVRPSVHAVTLLYAL